MITIHKYPLPEQKGAVETHAGARFLSAQKQNGMPCLWARVDTEQPKVKRAYKVFGTGEPINRSDLRLEPVGTCQIGAFVWHVFVDPKEGG